MKKLILLTALFVAPALAQEVDNRKVLGLSDAQRNYVLNEMRELLLGTQMIVGALANDDMASAAEAARGVGFAMKHSAENQLHDVLPKDFMMLGMLMHKDFDVIAADALAKKDPKHTLRQLSEVMGKCTACHATYQIQTLPIFPNTANDSRLDEVAERGRHVMPFDLDQTVHVFSKTATGGVQQVVVKDKANAGQVKLIQTHLSKIAGEFNRGDFSNPAKIHGDAMPGLSELRQAESGQIHIVYKALADGGEITYAAKDPILINALHRWFDAQLSDHARHAVAGHAHHPMHHK